MTVIPNILVGLHLYQNNCHFIIFIKHLLLVLLIKEPRATQIRRLIIDIGITLLKIADNIYKETGEYDPILDDDSTDSDK